MLHSTAKQAEISVSCGTIIVNAAREILLCHVTGTNFWDIPKGCQELGELPFEAAKRELFEETGLIFDDSRFKEIGNFDFQKNKRLHLFLLQVSDELRSLDHLVCTSYFSHRITGHPTPEMDDYRWVSREDITQLCTLPLAKRLIALDW